MSVTQLFCQGGCTACAMLGRLPVAHVVDVEVHDITTDPDVYETVISLGYRTTLVLVTPEGTSAAGAGAGELARRLTSRAKTSSGANPDSACGPTPFSTPEALGGEGRHTTWNTEPYRRWAASRKDQ